MQSTRDFIEAVRLKHGNCSYYRLAKILEVSEQAMTRYRKGAGGFSRDIALRVADELELPREYVIACVEAERETSPEVRPVWQSIAESFSRKVASILLAGCVAWSASPDAAASANAGFSAHSPAGGEVPSLYIMLKDGTI